MFNIMVYTLKDLLRKSGVGDKKRKGGAVKNAPAKKNKGMCLKLPVGVMLSLNSQKIDFMLVCQVQIVLETKLDHLRWLTRMMILRSQSLK